MTRGTQDSSLTGGLFRLDLSGVREGVCPLVVREPETALPVGDGGARLLPGSRISGSLAFDGGEYRAEGNLHAELEALCDRCLGRFVAPIGVRLELRIRRVVQGEGLEEDVLGIAPDATAVDLTEEVVGAVLLESPIKSLCRPQCRGLCPSCGKNRNEGNCECVPEGGDSRWDALKNLSGPISGGTQEE
ncbi:MAG: DUF177 domain-containing protein [Gemmatimonadota bacterium]|nr:DUF177 domain-containing protein [Gemmatimonadota bacterium]MDP7031530.1 DUF177 domain-containing protein [Gemmatimonadota bacterium]